MNICGIVLIARGMRGQLRNRTDSEVNKRIIDSVEHVAILKKLPG